MQTELERPIPLIGSCGQIALGNIVPPDISGPSVGKLVAVFHQVAPTHSRTVVPRDGAPVPSVTPARQLHLYRLPDRDREDQYLADTTFLLEDQWRTVPKVANIALKSLSYSWLRRTAVYPTLDTGKRKSQHTTTTTTTKRPPTKRTRAPKFQTISEGHLSA